MTDTQLFLAAFFGMGLFFVILYNVIKSAVYSAITKARQQSSPSEQIE